jgi:hypothetical protein
MTYNKNNTALMITMYIGNDKKRQKLYEKNILDWLTYTPFNIYTVESSDTKLNIINPRLHQYTFKQTNNNLGQSLSEKDSILRLIEKYPELESYELVFKITGRYFFSNFMSEFKNIPSNVNIVLQNASFGRKNWENTECFGMNGNRIKEILFSIQRGNSMYDFFFKIERNIRYILFFLMLYILSFILYQYVSKNTGKICAGISTLLLLFAYFVKTNMTNLESTEEDSIPNNIRENIIKKLFELRHEKGSIVYNFFTLIESYIYYFLFLILYILSFILYQYVSKNAGKICATISTIFLLLTVFLKRRVVVKEIWFEKGLKKYIMMNNSLKTYRMKPLKIKRKFFRNGLVKKYL